MDRATLGARLAECQDRGDLNDTPIKAHLKSFADAGLISKVGIPDKVLFVKALPRTTVRKFNKGTQERIGKPEHNQRN